jgi:quaternary ammonium compound-resistance protein SugE
MGWIYLTIAGLLEIAFTTFIRHAEGFTRFWPSFLTVVAAALSLYFVARATDDIPLGTAYAVWGAIGAVGTVIIGIAYYDEPVAFWRMFFLVILIVSIVGLKLVDD